MVRRYGYEKEMFFVAAIMLCLTLLPFSSLSVQGVPAGLQVSAGGGNFTLVTQNGDLYTWGVDENGYAEGLP